MNQVNQVIQAANTAVQAAQTAQQNIPPAPVPAGGGQPFYGGPAAAAAPLPPAQPWMPSGGPAPSYCPPVPPASAPGTQSPPAPAYGPAYGPAQPPCHPYGAQPPRAYYGGPPSYGRKPKDPRKTGAVRELNIGATLVALMSGLSLLIPGLVVYACLGAGLDLTAPSQGLSLVVLTAAMSPLCTAAPCLGYLLTGHKDWNQYLRFERTGPFLGLLLALGGLSLCLLANFPAAGIEYLLKSLGASDDASSLVGQGQSWTQLAVELFGVAVLVPLVEEFAFRGVIFSALRRFGTTFAVVGSGVIFGLAHTSPYSVLFAILAGIAMAWVYAVSGNLWVTAAIHMLNNAISVLGSYGEMLVGKEQNDFFQNTLMIVPLILGALSVVLLLTVKRGKLKELIRTRYQGEPVVGGMPLRAGETVQCLLKAAVVWGLFGIVLLYTLTLFL